MDIFNVDFEAGEATRGQPRVISKNIPGDLDMERIYKAILRVQDVEFPKSEKQKNVAIDFFVNFPDANLETDHRTRNFAGSREMAWAGKPTYLVFDITDCIMGVVNAREPICMTVITNAQR